MESKSTNANAIVEHFFRHESGKVIAHLCRVFGTNHIELIEDAVQEALYKAMQVWAFNAVPSNPSGWIMRVSKNKVIDSLRHENRNQQVGPEQYDTISGNAAEKQQQVLLDSEIQDDQLRLVFTCCHPSLSAESQLILILKLLCGFSTTEIARALLKKEEAVSKAFTRAKGRMKSEEFQLVAPAPKAIKERMETVRVVIYLLFNEGYKAADGDALIRKDLCVEAMRLCQLLLQHPEGKQPATYALMALMCFQASRFNARIDQNGNLVPFADQDRSLWSQELIRTGNWHLEQSAEGPSFTRYHIQATIASLYGRAKRYEETDWDAILSLHNLLALPQHAPIARLNRIVVYNKVHGPKAALKELKPLEQEKRLQNHHLLFAIKAELFIELGQEAAAIPLLEKAIDLAQNETEKKHLSAKLLRARDC